MRGSHGPHGPLLSGVVFHGMDYGPSFEAAQSLLLRGIETPYSTPTAMALCIARSFGLRCPGYVSPTQTASSSSYS